MNVTARRNKPVKPMINQFAPGSSGRPCPDHSGGSGARKASVNQKQSAMLMESLGAERPRVDYASRSRERAISAFCVWVLCRPQHQPVTGASMWHTQELADRAVK